MSFSAAIVVPCYNEARRLNSYSFRQFVSEQPAIHIVFVNDGSTDETLDILKSLERDCAASIHVVNQQPNRGKAEAVRAGMLDAFSRGFTYAGYWDADLATPLDEIPRFIALLNEKPDIAMVFGSRVKLLGRSIERNPIRHYLGRVFATAASFTLNLAVYDTQCGAKLFRNQPQIQALFAEPFRTGWIFDVEIVARLVRAWKRGQAPAPFQTIYELPLNTWHDVAGSRVKPADFLKALVEISRVYWHYLR
jgi:dolichyl-phosphate beta-glucosyltransferase